MMSASEGGSKKRRHSKGDCVNAKNQFQMRAWGKGVKKYEHFADVINGCSLLDVPDEALPFAVSPFGHSDLTTARTYRSTSRVV